MRLGRDQHLAAKVAAFLLGGELVLEMDAGRAGLDIGLHDLEAVEGPAEAGFGVGDDRREPVALRAALAMLDLVGALQRPVDPPAQLGPGIGRIERLVGIHGAGGVGVGGDLPAREIDRLEAGADHLHRLVAGDRAQRVDIILAVQQLPEPGRRRGGRGCTRSGSSRAAARRRRGRNGRAMPSKRPGAAGTIWVKSLMSPLAFYWSHQTPQRAPGQRQKGSLCHI